MNRELAISIIGKINDVSQEDYPKTPHIIIRGDTLSRMKLTKREKNYLKKEAKGKMINRQWLSGWVEGTLQEWERDIERRGLSEEYARRIAQLKKEDK